MPSSLCERYEIAFYECDEIKYMFLEVPATSLGKCCFPSSPLLGRSCVPSSFGVVLPFPSPFGCRSFPILLWCGPAFTSLPFELCYRSPHLLGGPAPASKNKQQPWWEREGAPPPQCRRLAMESSTTPKKERRGGGRGRQYHPRRRSGGGRDVWKCVTTFDNSDNSIAQFTTTLHA